MKVYTVHAYRWGDRERHSYTVGVFDTEKAAINAADREREYRGGNKYYCEVLEFQLNDWKQEPRIVLSLPVNGKYP